MLWRCTLASGCTADNGARGGFERLEVVWVGEYRLRIDEGARCSTAASAVSPVGVMSGAFKPPKFSDRRSPGGAPAPLEVGPISARRFSAVPIQRACAWANTLRWFAPVYARVHVKVDAPTPSRKPGAGKQLPPLSRNDSEQMPAAPRPQVCVESFYT